MVAGDTGGVRPSMVGVVWGRGRQGRGACGSGEVWHAPWWSGAHRAGVCRPGWLRTVRACKLLDSMSAGSAPAGAGRVRGLVRWGGHGVV